MLKYLIASGVLAAISIPLIMNIPSMTLFVVGWIMAAIAAVLLFMAIGTAISGKLKKKPSPWKLFAIGDIVLMVIAGLLSLGDALFSKGMGSGLLAAVLLYYGLPILVSLLIVELLAYKAVKMFSENAGPQEPETKLPVRIAYPAETKDDKDKSE